MIDINDIPQDLLDKIKEQFDRDPQVVQLRIRQSEHQKKGRFMEALGVAKAIEELYQKVVYAYMEKAEQEVQGIELSTMDMPLEDKERINMLGLVMFMACDIIESAIIDVDDTLHRYDRDLHFEMFNDIRQVADMARKKLQYLSRNSGYMADMAWGDKCDNMYEMMQSKASALMRKRKREEEKKK